MIKKLLIILLSLILFFASGCIDEQGYIQSTIPVNVISYATVDNLSSGAITDINGIVAGNGSNIYQIDFPDGDLVGTNDLTGYVSTTTTIDDTALSSNISLLHGYYIICIPNTDTLLIGDGTANITITSQFNNMNLVSVQAHVYTASTSGLSTINIFNITNSHDMLSVAVTIDENEKDSSTASTSFTIDTDYDNVSTGDEIRVDVDTSGTGTKGLDIILTFQLP